MTPTPGRPLGLFSASYDLDLCLLTRKVDRLMPLPRGLMCKFASKSVYSFSKYRVQKPGKMVTEAKI